MPVSDMLNAGEPVNGLVRFYQSSKPRVSVSSRTVNCFEQVRGWTGHHQGKGSNSPHMRRGEF